MYMPKGRREEKNMSRAQGDGYKTWTDHELNAYKWRLRDRVAKLVQISGEKATLHGVLEPPSRSNRATVSAK